MPNKYQLENLLNNQDKFYFLRTFLIKNPKILEQIKNTPLESLSEWELNKLDEIVKEIEYSIQLIEEF